MTKTNLAVFAWMTLILTASSAEKESKWISLFNGKDLSGWTVHGKATWSVQDGVLVGVGGMGHIYTDASCSDFEAKGMFRVTDQGATPNGGFYFRANPPADNANDFMISLMATRPRSATTARAIPDGSGNRARRPERQRDCSPKTGNGLVIASGPWEPTFSSGSMTSW